ncbi:MAG: hypothetical protein VYD19_06905 [Myxococcota bacterium]|nr:hypothetical protein [Myxococcota bacterium]
MSGLALKEEKREEKRPQPAKAQRRSTWSRWGWLLTLLITLAILYRVGELSPLSSDARLQCQQLFGPVGAEDIVVDSAGRWAYISSDDRWAQIAGEGREGSIWRLDLIDPLARPERLSLTSPLDLPLHPHGIDLWESPDGSESILAVVNHPAGVLSESEGESEPAIPLHRIERFRVDPRIGSLTPLSPLNSPTLTGPNDLILLGPDEFYVTNDHGAKSKLSRAIEQLTFRPWGSVVHHRQGGWQVVAGEISFPNGIALRRSAGREQLFVSSSTEGALYRFTRDPTSGALSKRTRWTAPLGLDNLSFDDEGRLWTGAHPRLFRFILHSALRTPSPSLILSFDQLDGASAPKEEHWLLDDGRRLSGASVAARAGDQLLIGTVFQAGIFRCQMSALALR